MQVLFVWIPLSVLLSLRIRIFFFSKSRKSTFHMRVLDLCQGQLWEKCWRGLPASAVFSNTFSSKYVLFSNAFSSKYILWDSRNPIRSDGHLQWEKLLTFTLNQLFLNDPNCFLVAINTFLSYTGCASIAHVEG